MNNIIKARLSAKKATKHSQTANIFMLSGARQYTEFLEKYNRSDEEVKTWMEKTKELVAAIHNIVDITPDALSEHLAAASGYGLNHTSAVFLMIHAALTEQKYLIPMVDIPVRISEEEKTHLLSSNCNPNPDMVERLQLNTNKTYSLRVDRENWFDKPSKLAINTEDMIEFMMLTRQIQHLEPLKDLIRFTDGIPFTSKNESMEIWKQSLDVERLPMLDVTVTPITAKYKIESHTSRDELVALVISNQVSALRKGDNRYLNWYMKEQIQLFAEGKKQKLTESRASPEIMEAIEVV